MFVRNLYKFKTTSTNINRNFFSLKNKIILLSTFSSLTNDCNFPIREAVKDSILQGHVKEMHKVLSHKIKPGNLLGIKISVKILVNNN